MAKSPLRTLVNILSDAVERIDSQFSAADLPFPTLDKPFENDNPSDMLLDDHLVVQQAAIVIAAAEQLCATVRNPAFMLMEAGLMYHKSSALRVAVQGNVPEILREAGPKGLHARDIASKNGMDPKKLSRILRLLATYHIFTEVTPNIFANNRISLMLDTKKPASQLSCPPKVDKYPGSNGLAAVIEYYTDEGMKSSAFMSEHFCDPNTSHSDESTVAVFNRVFKTDDMHFIWMWRPENEYRIVRFQAAMESLRYANEIVTPGAFPWDSLDPGSTIVDVGGGVGTVSMQIAKKYPDMKFVIQDLEGVTSQAKDYWNEKMPGVLEAGKVVFQVHSFFDPQPVKDADVFILRAITHSWPASSVINILKQLREVAVPGKTKLVLIETVLDYACRDVPSDVEDIVGVDKLALSVPEQLLPNLGRAGSWMSLIDMTMLINFNGEERMIGEHVHICKEAGWKVTHMYCPTGSGLQVRRQLLAVPV